jgi:hypothetical protein
MVMRLLTPLLSQRGWRCLEFKFVSEC